MSKENDSRLSDEFKKEIKESRKNNNLLGTFIAAIAIILVFGTVGIAGYQMIFRPDGIESKSASEKIESRPEEKKETLPATATIPEVATTPAAPASTPAATTTTYTVLSGDVLGSIASKFSVSVAKLMQLNGITDEGSLQIGQVLKLQ